MATIGPYHTTLPHITKDNWRDLAAQKREKRAQLIPVEWRLAPDLVAQAGDDVTGVAEQSGILSARELEITDLDEVKEVRVLVMSVVASPCGFEKVVVVRRGIVTENPRFPFSSVSQLAERIANQTYTAEEVAVAFAKRAAIAQQLTNCKSFFRLVLSAPVSGRSPLQICPPSLDRLDRDLLQRSHRARHGARQDPGKDGQARRSTALSSAVLSFHLRA
jgi:hypothetical protein